jgi:hypothetical protein
MRRSGLGVRREVTYPWNTYATASASISPQVALLLGCPPILHIPHKCMRTDQWPPWQKGTMVPSDMLLYARVFMSQ